MKKRIYVVMVVLVAIGLQSCIKHSAKGSQRLGKLVDLPGCAHYIVQLEDTTAADSGILTKSWTDTATGKTYTNVFGVSDICTFAASGVTVGAEFTFTLNGTVPDVTCNTCNIWPFLMPAATNAVTDVKLVTSP